MAKLVLSMDGLVLKEVQLTKERTTIGRRNHNDIVIDNLAISGEHALIVTIFNDSFLEDLGSTNGTMVNGQPISKHFLQSNDVIELGKYKLKYISEVAKNANQNELERTMVLPSDALSAPTAAESNSATLDSTKTQVITRPDDTFAAQVDSEFIAAAMKASRALSPISSLSAVSAREQAVIKVIDGPNMGNELSLTKTLTTLGRPGIQVAVITRRSQGYFITHVEGKVFPKINGKRLDVESQLLNDHDVIEISGTRMEFILR